ncbi:MAG TPA: FAD:protein FMN transferase [Gemmatimonadales bacterium]|jgi:thiamine biosynthesis lipoprotein
MGTTLRIGVRAPDRKAGIAAIEEAFHAVRRDDSLLSTWRDDSEITRLNRAPAGTPVVLPVELYRLLRDCQRWSRETGGAFDPGIGALVDVWDLRRAGRIPSAAELSAARARSGIGRFSFADRSHSVTRSRAGAWIDTGAFGKGAALGSARSALRRHGIESAFLNFGGQVLALGADRGADWIVPVADPARRAEPVMRLRLRGRSASTSAQSERWVEVEGRKLGHILDPRSGEPVPAWGSVTVVAEDPTLADVYSTALLVLGPERAIAWGRSRQDLGVLVLEDRQGRLVPRWNNGLTPFLLQDSTTRGG